MDDPKAFEELVRRHQGAVCAVAYAILRDRARSEEVAQEAFLIAWQKLPAVSPPPQLPAWVCGIARNLARNAARRPKEMSMTDAMTEPAAPATSPVDAMIDREREQLAEQALAQLDDREREAIVLYYRGDGSIADVATTLGISEPAARKRLQRGRDHLKSALGSVETALRATRPSHAFTAACVAALATRGSSAEAATKVASAPAKRAWIAAPIAALVVGGGVAAVATSRSSSTANSSEIAVVADARRATLDSAYVKQIDNAGRAKLIDQIRDAQRSRAARLGTGAPIATGSIRHGTTKVYDFAGDVLAPVKTTTPPPDPSTLGKATMRHAIRDVQPLLVECYTEAFDRLPRKDGVLEVRLTLVGEPGLATIVDEVELGGDAHLTGDTAFGECMRETLYAIEMPPMPQPETWTVNYPFTMPGHK